MAVAGAAEV